MVVSGIRWRCFISVVEGVVNVLYTSVMGWHVVMATFCICGWTTVVPSVIINHGGVVWSWYEWSWLSYLVQYCCQTISWLLSVWIGMEMVCVWWCVPPWWWYAATSRSYGRMFVAASSYFMMWGDNCWWYWCAAMWWWQVVVATSGGWGWCFWTVLFPHGDVWWCCYTWGWLLWLLIDVVVKLVLFAILGEGNLIQEELIFFPRHHRYDLFFLQLCWLISVTSWMIE